MNVLGAVLGRWHKRLVCLAWLCVVVELLAGGRYLEFLRPEFSYALWAMLAILAGFIVVDIAGDRRAPIRAGELLIAAALLLPLPYLGRALGSTLNSQAFERRFVGGSSSALDMTGYRADGGDAGETTVLDIYSDPDAYRGRRVSVVGMLERNNEQLRSVMGRQVPLVFRFVINCCAADAIPLAVVVDGDAIPPGLADDSWVRASGTFTVLELDGQEMPLLEEVTVTAASKPKQPYLY